jgi:SAM-dependent methyltransferase
LVRRAAKRSTTLVVANKIRRNLSTAARLRIGRTARWTGGRQSFRSTPESVAAYAHRTYGLVLERSGMDAHELAGRRILELGPGDNVGLALLLLAHGAEQVVAVDRFVPLRDLAREREIYVALRETLAGEPRRRFDAAVDLTGPHAAFDPSLLRRIEGLAIEEADGTLEAESFDIVLSIASGEHLEDSDTAFRAMDRLLRPGGRMLHQIDLRDHGLFSAQGKHPLLFLTVPDPIYRAMNSHINGPNRRMVDYYRRTLAALGYSGDALVTEVLGDGRDREREFPPRLEAGKHFGAARAALVEQIRPKLLPRYRALPVEDLLVAGVFVDAVKPADRSGTPSSSW